MSLFTPPKTNYTDFQDIGKFRMVWHASITLTIVCALLFIMHIVTETNWITSFLAFVVSVLTVVWLKYTLKYKLAAYWSAFISVLLCQALIFLVEDSNIIADTLWCVLVAFFSFYLLNAIIGTLILTVNITSLILGIYFTDQGILQHSAEVSSLGVAINILLVGAGITFIIYKITKDAHLVVRLYEKQLEQNEVLVKEIHHRVKNNLQVISSLLKLQLNEIEDRSVQSEFEDAIGRIRSMALIHEKMYQKEDLADISIKDYFDSLSQEISKTSHVSTQITIEVNSTFATIDSKSLVPISLIFNELMTNSVKHGFKHKPHGKIKVDFYSEGDVFKFDYCDDGEWIEPKREDSFGLEIIRILTEQLDGEFEREINEHTVYHFTFQKSTILFSKN